MTNVAIEEMNVAQSMYIKKCFLKAYLVDKSASSRAYKESLMPLTCLGKSDGKITFREGSKLALSQS